MGNVWSGHVMLIVQMSGLPRVIVYNLVHVPDSGMCKDINARMYDSLSSSSDDIVVTKHPLQLGFLRVGNLHLVTLAARPAPRPLPPTPFPTITHL